MHPRPEGSGPQPVASLTTTGRRRHHCGAPLAVRSRATAVLAFRRWRGRLLFLQSWHENEARRLRNALSKGESLAMDRLTTVRLYPRVFFAALTASILLCVVLFLLESFAPVPPWRQEVVHVQRSEWAALPPVPGNTVVSTHMRAGFVEPDTHYQVDYASARSCAEAQLYFESVAPAAGWEIHNPLQSFRPHGLIQEELETTYHKQVRAFTVSLGIDCLVGESGYSVILDSPPTD